MYPASWNYKPYYSLEAYFKEYFGEKIYKIALDAGMTCPNRDGTLDTKGCIFCSEGGSGDFAQSVRDLPQLVADAKIRTPFIAYFQSFTNTYAPVSNLEPIFRQALIMPECAGISVATRPDCFSSEIYALFQMLKKEFPDKLIWIELGLQTIHERTASYIRRGYSLSCFEQCMEALHKIGVPVIVHVILGLPGESHDDMLETVTYLNRFDLFGLKLQLLHVLKGTDLADDYEQNSFQVLSKEIYVELIADCLEQIRPNTVIHRLTGDGPKDLLIAPLWSLNKKDVLNSIHKKMKERNTLQGKQYYDTGCRNNL